MHYLFSHQLACEEIINHTCCACICDSQTPTRHRGPRRSGASELRPLTTAPRHPGPIPHGRCRRASSGFSAADRWARAAIHVTMSRHSAALLILQSLCTLNPIVGVSPAAEPPVGPLDDVGREREEDVVTLRLLRGGLKELDAVPRATALAAHLPHGRQSHLLPGDLVHGLRRVALDIAHPVSYIAPRFGVRDVINQQNAHRAPVVCLRIVRNRPGCCVPDLQLRALPCNWIALILKSMPIVGSSTS